MGQIEGFKVIITASSGASPGGLVAAAVRRVVREGALVTLVAPDATAGSALAASAGEGGSLHGISTRRLRPGRGSRSERDGRARCARQCRPARHAVAVVRRKGRCGLSGSLRRSRRSRRRDAGRMATPVAAWRRCPGRECGFGIRIHVLCPCSGQRGERLCVAGNHSRRSRGVGTDRGARQLSRPGRHGRAGVSPLAGAQSNGRRPARGELALRRLGRSRTRTSAAR